MAFTRDDFSALHYAAWAVSVPKPDAIDSPQALPADADPDLFARAQYFTAVARHGFPRGLCNLHFPDALTLEPYHAHPSRDAALTHLADRLCGVSSGAARQAELDVLDAGLVSTYFRPLEGVLDELQSACRQREFLFDPLYGSVFWAADGEIHSCCVTMAYWIKRVRAFLPPDQVTSPQAMLRQGIDTGRLFFAAPLGLSPQYEAARIPEIEVRTRNEFSELVEMLRKCLQPYPEAELWFRGQTTEYLVPDRAALVAKGVTRYSSAPRPNLVPALYRTFSKYTADLAEYKNLVLQFGRWSYWADAYCPVSTTPAANGELTPTGFAPDWESKRTDYDDAGRVAGISVRKIEIERQEWKQGLILQHYGAPSPYLDITSDPQTALWFATNRFTNGSTYRTHAWDDRARKDWPVVYVMPLLKGMDPFVNSALLVHGTSALRPQRQACGLLAAGGNLFRNFAATCVALRIRLAPGVTADPSLSTGYLFPSADEDGYLKILLENERFIRDKGGTVTFPVSSISQ